MKKRSYIKICPKCGGTNIGSLAVGGTNFGVPLVDYCKDCYYSYPSGRAFFPEIEESKIEDFRKKLKRKR